MTQNKKIFKTPIFSIILPNGWIADMSNIQILAFYKKAGDSGVIQVSTYSRDKDISYSKLSPSKSLQDYLKKQTKQKVKITTYERNKTKYAISDHYISGKWFSRAMVAENKKKVAFITYNIEAEYKNANLKEVEEIFDSFMFEI